MNLVPVNSTNILSIGDEDQILEVRFINGGIYQYLHVPHEVYSQFISAVSKGQFHHDRIIGHYPFRKLR